MPPKPTNPLLEKAQSIVKRARRNGTPSADIVGQVQVGVCATCKTQACLKCPVDGVIKRLKKGVSQNG